MLVDDDIQAYNNLFNCGTVDDYLLLLKRKMKSPSVSQPNSNSKARRNGRDSSTV